MIKKFVLIGLIVAVTPLTGCAVSRLEKDYGNSYRHAKFNQTLNPEAEKNLNPVYGFDGSAAQTTIEKYRKGFEKGQEKPAYTYTTGVMGVIGTGGQ